MAEGTRLIELHEPQQCCPGGVCSPEALAALVDIHEALQRFARDHRAQATVRRYVFPRSLDSVRDADLRQRLSDWLDQDLLPVTLLDGQVVKTGDYPSYDELVALSCPEEPR